MVYHRKATYNRLEVVGICLNCGAPCLEHAPYDKDYGQMHTHKGIFICKNCGIISGDDVLFNSEISETKEAEE